MFAKENTGRKKKGLQFVFVLYFINLLVLHLSISNSFRFLSSAENTFYTFEGKYHVTLHLKGVAFKQFTEKTFEIVSYSG